MSEKISTRERRIRQFEHYLDLMVHRRFNLEKGDCFVVFAHPLPKELRGRLSSEERIVQFAFRNDEFYLDMPDTTITPEEAKQLLDRRPGFIFALADSTRPKRPGEHLFDPVQRYYRYGEQREAAEDAAFIFFDLWKIGEDAWIKVEAASFERNRRWERNFSLA